MASTSESGGAAPEGQPDAAERWALAWAEELRHQVGHVRSHQPAIAQDLTRRCVQDLLAALTTGSVDDRSSGHRAVRRAAEALVAAQFTDEPLPVSLEVYRRHAPLAAPEASRERIGAVERSFFLAYIRAVRSAAAAGPETSVRAESLAVTAHRTRAEDLRLLLDAVFTQVSAPLAVVQSDGLVVRVNRAYTELTGCGAEEWTTLKVTESLDNRDATRLWTDFRRVAGEPGGESRRRVRYRHRDGRTIPAEVTLTHLPETSNYPGYVLLHAADHSDQALVRHLLNQQAAIDPETFLPNRTAFFQQLARACQEPTPGQALFHIRINDLHRAEQLGETACQNILLTVADQLQRALGPRDAVFGRLTHDALAVLVTTDGRADRRQLANVFHDIVRDGPLLAHHPLHLTAAIGIAEHTPGATPHALITAAGDAARRAAASEHARTVTAGSPADNPPNAASYRAPDGSLRIHSEPVRSLATGRPIGFLAAPTLPDHEGQPLTIRRFLTPPVATTDWPALRREVFTAACARLQRRNTTTGESLTLGLSLTGGQPPDPALLGDITAALADSGVAAEQVHFHVTQADIHRHPDTLPTTLTVLPHLGVRLVLTGLGAGPTDPAVLQEVPWNAITIDPRALPAELARPHHPHQPPPPEPDGSGAEIALRLALHAATLLDVPATADYVETPHQAHVLLQLGCDHAWGPYIRA